MDNTEEEMSALVGLPIEILEKIATNLDYKSCLNLRISCSLLKLFVDNSVGVKIRLIENPKKEYPKNKIDFFCGVALREVSAGNMLGQQGINGTPAYFQQNCSFDNLFSFPLLLKKINFFVKADVHFIYDVLTKCPNLESIFFSNNFEFEGDLSPLLLKEKTDFGKSTKRATRLSTLSERDNIVHEIKLPNLKSFYFNITQEKTKDNDFLNVMLLVKCIRSEKMEKAVINISRIEDFKEMEYWHYSVIMADFIEGHSKTLKHLTIKMDSPDGHTGFPSDPCADIMRYIFYGHNTPGSTDQGQGDSMTISKRRMVRILREKLEATGKKSKLTFLSMQMIPPAFYWDCWLLFIENLRKLVTLNLTVSTKYEILKNCGFLKNSRESLKRLRLDLDLVNKFDFSGIEECEKLEEVYVHFPTRSEKYVVQGIHEAHLSNLEILPPLKALSLITVVVDTKDLNKMLAKQKKLETLIITNLTSQNAENGCDCKSLKKICRMRSLHSCLIMAFRCKSRKTYNRIMQMIDFQLVPHQRRTLSKEEMEALTWRKPEFLVWQDFDIVSEETERRHIWEKELLPDGTVRNLTFRYQD